MKVGKYIIIVKKYNPPRMTMHTPGSKAVVMNHIHSIQVRLRNELLVLSVWKGHSVNIVPDCFEFD